MKRINIVYVFAGLLTFISSMLGYFVSKNWLFLAMFVGLNLFQFAFTNICPLELILKKLNIGK